jgi:hypothetical protein
MRKALMLSAAIVGVTMVAGVAIAQPRISSIPPPRTAPAPLLAAGIPAFAALGGTAAVGRFIRRRKAKTSIQTEGAELASNQAS